MATGITINARISEELNKTITEIAKKAERTKSYIISKALQNYVLELEEDIEDYTTAMQIISENNPTISWEDVKKDCGLLEN